MMSEAPDQAAEGGFFERSSNMTSRKSRRGGKSMGDRSHGSGKGSAAPGADQSMMSGDDEKSIRNLSRVMSQRLSLRSAGMMSNHGSDTVSFNVTIPEQYPATKEF